MKCDDCPAHKRHTWTESYGDSKVLVEEWYCVMDADPAECDERDED